MPFSLSPDYGYTLLSATFLALQVLLIGFYFPGRLRNKLFPLSFMKIHFGQQHQKSLGVQIKAGGAPDMGCGRYSDKLSYKQWHQFNSAQRAHGNFVEWIASSIAFILIAGVYFPLPAAALGFGVIIGRLLYAIGYSGTGPEGRAVGVVVGDLSILGLLVLSIISSIFLILQKDI